MIRIVGAMLLIGSVLSAEDAPLARTGSARSTPDFQTGQAARLVLGQTSFTARDGQMRASNLVYASGRLFATEQESAQQFRVDVFDVSDLPAARSQPPPARDGSCSVCGFMPSLELDQQVPPDSPAVVERQNARIVADIPNRRVLIWHSAAAARAGAGADLVLSDRGGANGLQEPVSVEYDGRHLFVGDAGRHQVLVWRGLPIVDEQPADAILGSPNESTGPDAIRTPAALASDGEDLFVADPANGRILVFTPGDVPLAHAGIMNAASLAPDPLAIGTLIDIDGSGLSDGAVSAPDENQQPLPTGLGGVQVFLNGLALPLLSVSPTEVRTQIPYTLDESAAASLYVRTQHADGQVTITNAAALRTAPATPGIFGFGGPEPRQGMILHAAPDSADGAGTPVTAADPARPGEQLIVWATGLGKLDSDVPPRAGVPYNGPGDPQLLYPVSASIDGQPAQVVSARLPQGGIGIYEIRLLVPASMPAESVARLIISQNGVSSNAVTFQVKGSTH
jgi:uncharacterized protein (TIGR03437 family)